MMEKIKEDDELKKKKKHQQQIDFRKTRVDDICIIVQIGRGHKSKMGILSILEMTGLFSPADAVINFSTNTSW